jgi:chromosomal replication initiator protein
VRQRLISIYGEAIDRNWFSKLTPCYIDEKKKEIKLKVPTSFVRDWIKENYFNTIENIFLDEQIESVDVITVR